MSIIERQIPRGLGASALAMAADASARFIYDLATASLPMAIATVKAASDAVEAETRQHQRAAVAARKRTGRVRLQLVG